MMLKELIVKDNALEEIAALGYRDPARSLGDIKALLSGPFGPSINLISELALSSPSPTQALLNLARISDAVPDEDLVAFIEGTQLKDLMTLCGSSELFTDTIIRHPSLFKWLFIDGAIEKRMSHDEFEAALKESAPKDSEGDSGEESIGASMGTSIGTNGRENFQALLRVFKNKEYLRMGLRDLTGRADLVEVTAEISALASVTLDAATTFTITELKKRYGAPLYTDEEGVEREAELCALGMGKLGGGELNFSSDIDLIFLYTTELGETTGIGDTGKGKITLHEFFVKCTERIKKLMDAVTGDGFVFRVDLDLRPGGRSGDAAISLSAMEHYYESFGQTWERSAMIKARPVAGSKALGEIFIKNIRPFIYRKYLDFTAIDELKSMKEKIDVNLLRRDPDTIDVKLGAGGIREIEFFCQALQLIHGGKEPALRERSTVKTLGLLVERGFINADISKTLKEGYFFLRSVEHRLQITEGRQTHAIPKGTGQIRRIAKMSGLYGTETTTATESFWTVYKDTTERVYDIYRSLFYRPGEEMTEGVHQAVPVLLSAESDDEIQNLLLELGFRDPRSAQADLARITAAPFIARLSARARVLLDRLLPFMLTHAADSPDPDKALFHLESFLTAVGAKATFYALLSENRKVTELLVKIFGTSEFLSQTILEKPDAVGLLLSNDLKRPVKEKAELNRDLNEEFEGVEDYEGQLNALRRFKNQETFRIGINDILGDLEPGSVTLQMTSVAECLLERAIEVATSEVARRFGRPPKGRFAVLGLGKVGTTELSYGSDLDIIFLYDDPPEDNADNETDGARPISYGEFYMKLGQKIISVLTLRTNEGVVFPVDMRLRPSGSAGPLVVSRSAFINYPRLIWERQALIKARPVAGDMDFAQSIEAELRDLVFDKTPTQDEVEEILRIRQRMEKEIAKEDEEKYNIKTGLGGIVDIEFIIELLQLCRGGGNKDSDSSAPLRTPITPEALTSLYEAAFINEEDFSILSEAYAFYRRLENNLRIVNDRGAGELKRGSKELATLARRVGYENSGPASSSNAGESLLDDFLRIRKDVRAVYTKITTSLSK